ncbi:hypothetical protein ACP275_14G228100 [Erythranthe tilingii]
MGPTACRRRTRKSSASARRRKTLIFKTKQQQLVINSKNQESSPVPSPANSKADDRIENNVEMYCSSPCSTPKAERYRIPKIETCPPAPKKRRIVTNCSLKRTSIAFFASPDIDLFFNFALCGVPV